MSMNQYDKGAAFRELHRSDGVFIMPNAWDAGSACLLAASGFPALGTTSAGIAFSKGLPDSKMALSLDAALEVTSEIACAVNLPVSADSENGYGHDPEIVAETIARFAQAGVVGASIEDHASDYGKDLYELELGVERIKAARAAADALDFPLTLTARAECYLVGHENAFAESVKRVNAYREAGADCLYVPGVRDAETIGNLVREVDGPLNVVMGLSGKPMSVAQLADLGVKRVSIGGSLARATMGLIRRSAQEIFEKGTFGYASQQIADSDLCEFFRGCLEGKREN